MNTSKGIILKTTKFREADLLVTILLHDGSLENYTALNALKSKKRFGGGVLEPSHFVTFSWEARNASHKRLAEAKLIEDFPNIRKSYDSIQCALKGLHLVYRVSQENLESKDVFDLLGNFLKNLNSEADLAVYQMHFEVRLFKLLGLMPSLEEGKVFFQHPLAQSQMIQLNNKEKSFVSSHLMGIKADYGI